MATVTTVEAFKSAIDKIRNIFRALTPSITGMDSMRHLCLYLLSRYITKENCESFGIPDKFCWESLYEQATKSDGAEISLDSFYNNKGIECLINHIDNIFGTHAFIFIVENPNKHKEILQILNNIDLPKLEMTIDILGWVYELHLAKGSSGSGMRDLGQYFTDRYVCQYMTELVKPKMKSEGVPESVCDPSMGTGGFLTSYLKYYKQNYPTEKINWTIQQEEVHGYDTDKKLSAIGRLNMFIETKGNIFKHLYNKNSISKDQGLDRIGYDIILANMPFGIKGMKYADCCERVKALKINGTKSEPLFLQLIMTSLNTGGRCAVVVPDGVVSNDSELHKQTRKYLLDNFELKKVIRMKGKFFVNTGIQTYILYFENNGSPTSSIEFCEIEKDDKGNVSEEKNIGSVTRDNINDKNSLDIKTYFEISEILDYKFEIKKLGDIGELCHNNSKIIDNESGCFRKYFGPKIVGNCSNYHFDGEYILTPNRQSIGLIGYVNEKFTTTHTFVIKIKSEFKTKFVYYYLKLNDKLTKKSKGVIPYIRNEDVLSLQIPIPPIEIQEKIVEGLDCVYDAKKRCEQSIQNCKTQIKLIMQSINSRGFEMKKLGEIITKKSGGKTKTKDLTNTGEYPFYSCNVNNPSGTHSSFDNDEPEYLLFSKSGGNSKHLVGEGMGIGKFYYLTEKTASSSDVCKFIIICKGISYKFLSNILKSKLFEIQKLAKYTTGLGHIDVETMLNTIQIPVPPLEFQTNVLERVEKLEKEISFLEESLKDYDSNAKFILESYLTTIETEKEETEDSDSESDDSESEDSDEEEIKDSRMDAVISHVEETPKPKKII